MHEKVFDLQSIQEKSARNILDEIINCLERSVKTKDEVKIVAMPSSISKKKNNYTPQKPNVPQKEQSLIKALNLISDKSLIELKNSLFQAINHLRWSIDDGLFYEKSSELGTEFLNGNMHTEIIGPENGIFKHSDLRLGLFLLEANIFYKDHMHEAPEIYFNLSNSTSWRFGIKNWIQKEAGSIVHNKPFEHHAMYVGDSPFLSVWCWPYSSSKKCVLVPVKVV